MTDEKKPLISRDELFGLNKSLKLTKNASNRFTIRLSEVSEEKEIDFVTAVFVAKFDTKLGFFFNSKVDRIVYKLFIQVFVLTKYVYN